MRARHLQALAAITIAGGVIRFATLGVQSFWLDEAATVDLMHRGFGAMLRGVSGGESTPPLYYCIAWIWVKVFGTSEAGLRSLSALIGTATIPVAYVLGRRVAGRLTGLVAAALCAFSPLLVWYSQEARSYALLVLLCGLSLLAMLDVLDRPGARRLAVWAAVGVAALATHYFAGFLLAAEAAWIIWRVDSQARARVAVAVGVVTVAAGALLPLALHQRATGNAKFISQTSLASRAASAAKQFAIGYQGPLEILLTALAALIVAFGLFRLLASAPGRERHRALVLAAVGLAAVVAPFVLALIGPDYFIARNLLPAWLPFGIALAVGLAAPGARREGVAAAGVLCAIGLALVIASASNERYQRNNWRGAARALGARTQPRAIIVTPASGALPLRIYLPHARVLSGVGVNVRELDFIGMSARLPGEAPNPPRPGVVAAFGFTEFARKEAQTYTVLRERSHDPVNISGPVGASQLDGRPGALVYQP